MEAAAHRVPAIAGNWKMHRTMSETVEAIRQLRSLLDAVEGVELFVAPPFTALAAAAKALDGSTIGLAAQDVHAERAGAFTGEVSVSMLRDAGCQRCIVGHSERRQLFAETDADVQRKVRALLAGEVDPILCVGETLDQRRAGRTLEVVETQVRAALDGLSGAELGRVIVAYEPVWAIGTGQNATPEQAQEVHSAIRNMIEKASSGRVAAGLRIVYGGSMKPDNAGRLLAQPDVDGGLVGGASLDHVGFAGIVRSLPPRAEADRG